MQAYQQRVVHEQQELDLKIDKLSHFITSKDNLVNVSDAEVQRLYMQLNAMQLYSAVLDLRIKNFWLE